MNKRQIDSLTGHSIRILYTIKIWLCLICVNIYMPYDRLLRPFKIITIRDALFITMCDNSEPVIYFPSLFYVFI